ARRKYPYRLWLEDKLSAKLQTMAIFSPHCLVNLP
ncbi:MAG: hypothetical protein AVDCRST_MAG93-223, partial [uncultured Chloroflexia bacterium]